MIIILNKPNRMKFKMRINYKNKKGSAIFDKLTNPKLYTGAHKSRFDEEGRGLGINNLNDEPGKRGLEELTRPNLHKGILIDSIVFDDEKKNKKKH